MGATRFSNGHASSLSTSKLSQIVSAKTNKPKVSEFTWGFYASNLWSRGTTTGFLPSCCCQRLHSFDSKNVKALYRRAQAYIQLVDLDLAEQDIKKALEIDPDSRDVKLESKTLKDKVREYNKKDA
nr:70 kDa peptidyl-prolyl isomerase-like [Quercus suber]POF04666.1 peptidyl-prolyl cis-trans isomerase fkbp65 [Quercus suber]